VILGLDCEALVGGIGGGTARNGKREQDPVELQAQVPVEVPGRVLVHHEDATQFG